MHRILIIGYLPGTNGIATAVKNLYLNLDRNVFQYDVLIPEKKRDISDSGLVTLQKHGAGIHYMDYLPSGFSKEKLEDLRRLLLSIPDISGVHVHDFALNVDPLILADEMKLPVKVIHSHVQATAEMIGNHRLSSEERKKLEAISGDHFVRLACSDYSGDYAFGGLDYSVFPNAVDVKRFSYNPVHRSVIRRSLNIPDNVHVLGFVGAHDERKNPMFALRVFREFHRQYPESHIIIAGNGSLFDDLKEYADQVDLSEYTHFVGYQSEMELFFNTMDLLVFPSESEGLPYALVEAQACGLPCLVSDSVSNMSRITDLVTMESLQEDALKWAETAHKMLENSRKRSNDNKKIADAGFDIREAATKMESIYYSCLCSDY